MMQRKPIILIVDDDRDTRDTLSIALSLDGYNVRVAACRLEAMDMIDQEVAAVLLDYNMPGMTASEFVNAVHAKVAKICIVLVSAAENVKAKARDLGLQHSIADLRTTMEECAQSAHSKSAQS